MPAYGKIQGNHGEAVLGLSRALTRINDSPIGNLGKLGVIPETLNVHMLNSERAIGKLKPITVVF